MPAIRPPMAPPMQPAIKHFIYLKLTPKITGSVIPRNADREDGSASAFSFWFLVFNAIASAAAPWATFAALAMGIQMLIPSELNSPASRALYI